MISRRNAVCGFANVLQVKANTKQFLTMLLRTIFPAGSVGATFRVDELELVVVNDGNDGPAVLLGHHI